MVSLCEKYPNFDKVPQEVIDYYNDNIEDFLEEVQKGYACEICIDTKNGNPIVEILKIWESKIWIPKFFLIHFLEIVVK